MAYPKNSSSLALVALVLFITASLPNCQAQLLPIKSLAVIGTVHCNTTLPTPPPVPVDVTLSCDGGVTAVVPPVKTSLGGVFFIDISGLTATVVNPINCSVFVKNPVTGCIVLSPGQALRAPLIPVGQTLLATTFQIVTIT